MIITISLLFQDFPKHFYFIDSFTYKGWRWESCKSLCGSSVKIKLTFLLNQWKYKYYFLNITTMRKIIAMVLLGVFVFFINTLPIQAAVNKDRILFTKGTPMLERGSTSNADPLTATQRSKYEEIRDELAKEYQDRVDSVITSFIAQTKNDTVLQKELQKQRIIEEIDRIVLELLGVDEDDLEISRDTINDILLLLKYELLLLDYNSSVLEVYGCNTWKEFRLYYTGYVVDDEVVTIESNELHASDAKGDLPTYTGEKTVASQGTKYNMRDSDTNKSYIFWIKSDVLTVADKDTVLHVCLLK